MVPRHLQGAALPRSAHRVDDDDEIDDDDDDDGSALFCAECITSFVCIK